MKNPIVPLFYLRSIFSQLLYNNRLLVVLVGILMICSFQLGSATTTKQQKPVLKEVPQVKAAAIAIPTFVDDHIPAINKPILSQFQEISIGQAYYVPIPTATPTPISSVTGGGDTSNSGNAKQIDSHTWTVQVAQDSTMASAREIFQALNIYRQSKGRTVVSWNDSLASFAQKRADSFNAAGTLDGHAGFMQFVNQQDGFHKLGFGSLGENSSIGYLLSGTHLIESVYAADSQHNNNQLDTQWTDVGVGVNGTATDLIFGGKRL